MKQCKTYFDFPKFVSKIFIMRILVAFQGQYQDINLVEQSLDVFRQLAPPVRISKDVKLQKNEGVDHEEY